MTLETEAARTLLINIELPHAMPISSSPLPVQKLPIHPKRQLAIALRAPFKAVDLSPMPTRLQWQLVMIAFDRKISSDRFLFFACLMLNYRFVFCFHE